MRRREIVIGAAMAVVAQPRTSRTQPAGRAKRIGVLVEYEEGDPEAQARLSTFRDGLHSLGWTDGSNAQIAYRYAGGDPARIRALAAELAGLPRPGAAALFPQDCVMANSSA